MATVAGEHQHRDHHAVLLNDLVILVGGVNEDRHLLDDVIGVDIVDNVVAAAALIDDVAVSQVTDLFE